MEYHYDGVTRTDVRGHDKTEQRAIVRLVKSLNVLLVGLPFALAWAIYYSDQMRWRFYRRGNWLVIFLAIVLYYLLAHLYGGFLIHIKRISEIIYAQVLATVITDFIMLIVMWLLIRKVPNVLVMLVVFITQVILITFWTRKAHQWYFRHNPAKPTVIIYDEMEGLESLINQYGLDNHFNTLKTVSVEEIHGAGWDALSNEEKDAHELKKIREILQGMDAVFLCCLHSHIRNQIIKYCVSQDINSWCIPRIGDVIMAGAEKHQLFHLPMLRVARYNPTPEYLILKRLFDIVVAGTALLLLWPLMLVLAVLIRRDGGTAFYRQKRLTKDGKIFEILKFRSMRMDAEKDGVPRLSTGEKDPRITPVGHFIRACRFDELPQIFNILSGDMSIVGPRPERPEIAQIYKQELPEFDLRLQCKCGLTGYAQVYGQYNTTPYNKLLMDLMYIAKPSMAEDIKICFATVKILFMKDSTEGIEEGSTTATGR